MKTYRVLIVEKIKFKEERDRDILALFQKDPKRGFRSLYDTYYMALCIYVVQMTDSFEMAEDVVQDFFVYFWEKKYYLKVTENLRNYLYLSVRNATLAALRKEKMVSMEELSGLEMNISEELPDREELREQEMRLMADLELLPKRELEVLKAIVLENKKYKEAAHDLNISVNTLKTHLARGLGRLRKNHNLLILWMAKNLYDFLN